MEATEELYETVGGVLVQHAPDGFATAWVDAEINDDHSRETYDYIDADGNEKWFTIGNAKDGFRLSRALRAIRDEMFEQTGDKWKKVRFTVNKDMTFETEFEYD